MYHAPTLEGTDFLQLTPVGRRQLNEPGTTLPPRHLEALVLIDGTMNFSQVERHMRQCVSNSTEEVLRTLIDRGFVQVVPKCEPDGIDPGSFFGALNVVHTSTKDSDRNVNAAAAGSRLLEKNGFCVNLARTLYSRKLNEDRKKPTILAIDDDPDICNLLKLYLKLENFEARTASNRAEIIENLRRDELPDLILLDIFLPDINGFDLLASLRNHPLMRAIPVIMLTAESSRGGVLRGIDNGADGYVTKPFRIQPLVCAIKAVLGLDYSNQDMMWDSL